ncbi:MAG TPA: hypothetical protein VIV15_00480, partial [Anaerolineales bacterium]
KVREGLARGDYKDPGWYKHPPGTVAFEWKGEPPELRKIAQAPAEGGELRARKPSARARH